MMEQRNKMLRELRLNKKESLGMVCIIDIYVFIINLISKILLYHFLFISVLQFTYQTQ